MKKISLIVSAILFLSFSFAQKLEDNRTQIENAQKDLALSIADFSDRMPFIGVDSNLSILLKTASIINGNAFHDYTIGGLLYEINPEKSFEFHQRSFNKNPNDVNILLEYALELHRKQEFDSAAILYQKYLTQKEEDYRIFALLSDCYFNQYKLQEAIEAWKSAKHESNHTSIDFAIYIIYGNYHQVMDRDKMLQQIKLNDFHSFEDLISLDMNWEKDWWNGTMVQEKFVEHDLKLAKEKLGVASERYKLLNLLVEIKKLDTKSGTAPQIKTLLEKNHLIVNDGQLPVAGKITSELLRIAFINGWIDADTFYKNKGTKLLQLSDSVNSADLLNVYAYLQATVNEMVDSEIDKKGWKKYKDERFASSYFIGLADKNRYDNPDLKQAIIDFPNSASIQWIKLNCAKIEDKPLAPELVAFIKKEFKSLSSDRSRYSYQLSSYIYMLEDEPTK